jgi:hypothetical protein
MDYTLRRLKTMELGDLGELFWVLFHNQAFTCPLEVGEIPPGLLVSVRKLTEITWEYWYVTHIVNSRGNPWTTNPIHGIPETVFVIAVTEGRGTLQDRIIVPLEYQDGNWSDPDPLCLYRDYSRVSWGHCAEGGGCYCIKCTSARVIQVTYLVYRVKRTRRVLEEIFEWKYGSSVPNVVDMIMYYYQSNGEADELDEFSL